MNPVERVRAALEGGAVDRSPFTVWYHFGLQHAPAERVAQAHLEFLEAYDLDLLKVMNDYSYPMPRGLETLDRPEDLARVEPLDPAAGPLGEQLRVIELLARALRGRVLFVDTLFNPWNTLRRSLARDALPRLMREHPEAVLAALDAVTETLIRFARASLDRGAAGLFLSVPAAAEFVSPEEYERFMRPFDLRLLEAVRGRGAHVLHAHGSRLYLERLLDYPVACLSWADRDAGPPLATVRRLTRLTLMGGLSHAHFAYVGAARIRAQVRAAVAEAGPERLILAPGCALPSYAFPELIRAARDEARR